MLVVLSLVVLAGILLVIDGGTLDHRLEIAFGKQLRLAFVRPWVSFPDVFAVKPLLPQHFEKSKSSDMVKQQTNREV